MNSIDISTGFDNSKESINWGSKWIIGSFRLKKTTKYCYIQILRTYVSEEIISPLYKEIFVLN